MSAVKRLCSICARGGSQGVKGKNLRELNGLSLLAISIIQARKTKLFNSIAVSSDSDEILEEAKANGVEIIVKRPDELATATAGKIPAIQHCVLAAEELVGHQFDVVVDLDATSPLRLVDDILKSVELLETQKTENVITGMPARRSPYFNLVEEKGDGFVELSKKVESDGQQIRIVRRQDVPNSYDMNASIYVWKRPALFASEFLEMKNTKIHIMPEERSIDVDSELDFEFVRFLSEKNKRFENEW